MINLSRTSKTLYTYHTVESIPRHRCLLYEGPPSRQLPMLAAVMCQKIQESYRCLYLNSPTMVAGMGSYLAARGRDVLEDTKQGRLVLSSEQHSSGDGLFDTNVMLRGLEDALEQALKDGYKGLWASGDMTWEFGPAKDFCSAISTCGGSCWGGRNSVTRSVSEHASSTMPMTW